MSDYSLKNFNSFILRHAENQEKQEQEKQENKIPSFGSSRNEKTHGLQHKNGQKL